MTRADCPAEWPQDKVRVNCANWEDAKVILAEEAPQVVALGKNLTVARGERPTEYLNLELPGSKRGSAVPQRVREGTERGSLVEGTREINGQLVTV